MTSNLYFWRDNSGIEVDVIAEHGKSLMPIEIKSGQTITADYYIGLKKWLAVAGETAGRPKLVYGGNERYTRSGIEVIPWRTISGIAEKV